MSPWPAAAISRSSSIFRGESWRSPSSRRHGPPSPVPSPNSKQQLEPVLLRVWTPAAVVERLPIVGVSAGLQQQTRQRELLRVLRDGAAAAQRAGQRGERWDQPLPQVPGVRIGAVLQQQPRDRDRRAARARAARASRSDTAAAPTRAGRRPATPGTGRGPAARGRRRPRRSRRSCGCSRAASQSCSSQQ